jgi:acyl transferase domain-containing protein
MASVAADISVVKDLIARVSREVGIAAFNGPENIVVSGPREPVEQVVAQMQAGGLRVRLLRVPFAAHSRQVEPVLPAFRKALESVTYSAPAVELISNLTGGRAGLAELGRADYWLAHLREPVRFHESMQALAAQGITHFIEIGPHPVLLGMGG